ncbi:hypothetical protein [Paenibacillus sp. P22]|uniref:hypothetical protein n=1 Tax=Paenibacillus sp. P22 TaxID=483908 RepID=UPI0012EDB143|nr:hypothetical protein [Paenibacillus sp. P22]
MSFMYIVSRLRLDWATWERTTVVEYRLFQSSRMTSGAVTTANPMMSRVRSVA